MAEFSKNSNRWTGNYRPKDGLSAPAVHIEEFKECLHISPERYAWQYWTTSLPPELTLKERTAVINLWLSGGLVIAVLGYAILSGLLILKLGGFEDARRQAQEAEDGAEKRSN